MLRSVLRALSKPPKPGQLVIFLIGVFKITRPPAPKKQKKLIKMKPFEGAFCSILVTVRVPKKTYKHLLKKNFKTGSNMSETFDGIFAPKLALGHFGCP